jgi:hypothetical protein
MAGSTLGVQPQSVSGLGGRAKVLAGPAQV